MRTFVLATGNIHKAREVCEIVASETGSAVVAAPIEARDRQVVGFGIAAPDSLDALLTRVTTPVAAPDVAETGATLEENARIKARAVATALGVPAVADDTGLEVDALGGAPGVHSARYAGAEASDAENRAKLLDEMTVRLRASRTARFVTVALWFDPMTGAESSARGVAEGVIVDSERGTNGFGYDALFAPAGGRGQTFAEMSAAQKHAISHRGRAFRTLARTLMIVTEE